MLIEPTSGWGDPNVWIPIAGVSGGIAAVAAIVLLMLCFIWFVTQNSSVYYRMGFPKKTVISLLFILPSMTLLSILTGIHGGKQTEDVYVQFSQAAETTYGFPLSRDAIDLLLEGNFSSILATGGPEGVRQTLGSITLALPAGDLPVTLSWAGTEWVLLSGDSESTTELERTN